MSDSRAGGFSLLKSLHLDKIHTVVAISQFSIYADLILLILQMTFTSRYNNNMIVICTTLSYLMSIFLMGMLSKQFFSWYKSSNNTIVIFYAISSALIALNAVFTLILVDIILLQQPTEVRPHAGLVAPTVSLFFNSIFIKQFAKSGIYHNHNCIVHLFLDFNSLYFYDIILKG